MMTTISRTDQNASYKIPKCFYFRIVLGICLSLPYENNSA